MLNYNDISLDNQIQFGTISQQPTANSQQPTANSQTLIKIVFYFIIQSFLLIRAVSDFFRLLFFYVLQAICYVENLFQLSQQRQHKEKYFHNGK